MKKTIEHSYDIAVHDPSGCELINEKWMIDSDLSPEEYILGAQSDYENYADIIDESNDDYDAANLEQEHDDDYRIDTRTVTIEYDDSLEQEFSENQDNFKKNRDSYYGWSMNGGGGKKAFSKMYGNGNFTDFITFILENGAKIKE